MHWKFVILRDRNLISVRAWGGFSTAAFEEMIHDIQSHEQWGPNMDRIFDFNALDLTETTPDDIRTCAEIHMKHNSRIGNGRIAIIFNKEEAFGMGRLYESCLGSDVLATVKSFHTADEARHWLSGG